VELYKRKIFDKIKVCLKFDKKAINNFSKKYKPENWIVVGLEGEKTLKNMSYPCEI